MVKENLPCWVHQDPEEVLVHINVGGLKKSLWSSTLKKFPDTRLGKLLCCHCEDDILQVCDDYDVQEKEFYFDRNPNLIPYVMHFYQTGKLHIMEELCVFSFSQEMEYWGINDFFLDSCCSFRYHDRKLASSRLRHWDDDSDVSSVDTSVDEITDLKRDMQHFREVPCGGVKKFLWLMLENPGYSVPSKLFSLMSISVVLASISNMCINSIPEHQVFDSEGRQLEDWNTWMLEVFCSCWFTSEMVMRLLLAPNRRKFFRHPLNIIDMVLVLPIYVTLLWDWTQSRDWSQVPREHHLIEVFRLMRVFRVLKLARHSTGLRSLGATLRHSYREVGILLLYLGVGVCVFSGVAYTAEYEEDVGLDTLPACWWWGTVTMTTVGYGDVVPVTVAGKLAASGCILGGTLVVALPITLIFNKFSHFYRRQKALEASVREGNRGGSCGGEQDRKDQPEESAHDSEEEEGGVVNYSYVEHPSLSERRHR